MTYKVLIADDHVVVREGLKLLIETNENYKTIGEAGHGAEAIQLVNDLEPDIILMDLYMPVMSGMEAIRKLSVTHPKLPIIILTTYNEDQLLAEGFALGAKGYLLKDTSLQSLFHSMDAAMNGETLIGEDMMKRIRDYQEKRQHIKEKVQLSRMEIIILQAVARGTTSKDIAFDIGVSERTVKSRLTAIFNKLGVDSRTEAVAVAIESGMIHLNYNKL
ncbi:response regulator transcription factor [Terribacillus saccharophilus]|uniref:response regulator transcription factor n=1 Tax=Terribacillus saccharophilus TaxID=361277 RepID=UPI002DD16BB4|nr:response regulator transcription factor [Terribacillus saccharophilus]MEC0289487.1 response regulator transcription factor [Terribacillus saccharophilus]